MGRACKCRSMRCLWKGWEGLGVPCFLAGMLFCKGCCIYNIQPSGRPTCALLNVQHLAPAAAPG